MPLGEAAARLVRVEIDEAAYLVENQEGDAKQRAYSRGLKAFRLAERVASENLVAEDRHSLTQDLPDERVAHIHGRVAGRLPVQNENRVRLLLVLSEQDDGGAGRRNDLEDTLKQPCL